MNAPDPLAHQAIAGPRWRPAPLLRALGPAFGTLMAPTPLPATTQPVAAASAPIAAPASVGLPAGVPPRLDAQKRMVPPTPHGVATMSMGLLLKGAR